MTTEHISYLIGGLGLLLIGMNMMTDGLRLASGNALRNILALWTNTRPRGLFAGFLITGVVQSSSAVTVATIGFANAGMLTLERAIWVIFGSNVGTTMTAWIVALIGFRINLEGLALPLIGIGVLLKFTGGSTRRAPFGIALTGFGLLFLGIGFLKATFDGFGNGFNLPAAQPLTLTLMALYIGSGFLLTTVMQSSSAAMVIALGAAESGLVPLNAAAAIVIGANLGTTTTALLAIIGATATAKRVAVSHVVFNLITALVAFGLLGPLLALIAWLEQALGLQSSPAMTLALFHTTFNILGVLLMWPLSGLITRFLATRFTTREESESTPRHLDRNVLALPYIAIDALALEISRLNALCLSALRSTLLHDQDRRALDELKVAQALARHIGNYSAELNRTALTPFLAEAMGQLMESTQQYLLIIDIADDIRHAASTVTLHDETVIAAMAEYTRAIERHLAANDLDRPEQLDSARDTLEELEASYRVLKKRILGQAAAGAVTMDDMDQLLQHANQSKRACRQFMKATRRLVKVRQSLQRDAEGNIQPAELTDSAALETLHDPEDKPAADSTAATTTQP